MAKVAFLLPDMGGGGSERVVISLLEAFVADGHDVHLVLGRARGEFLPMVPRQVRVVDLAAPLTRSAIAPLARYLRRERPDTLQASMWPMTIVAIVARMIAWVPTRLVISDHTILSRQYADAPQRALLRATTRWLYPRADARICVSAACADDLARLSGISRDAFTVVPNPIALAKVPGPTSAAKALWPAGTRRILTVGSLKPVKNHFMLLDALAKLRQWCDASLVIAGKGMLTEQTRQRADALGLGHVVTIPGFQEDVAALYAAAELFVLSSEHEGFGNVLVEALLAGLPIVSTDCPGEPRNILADGKFGALVPVGDADALASAMASALERPADAESQRRRGRVLADSGSLDRYRALMLGGT